jgi:RNA polymerase sigma-70 factor (ECF subfamily)
MDDALWGERDCYLVAQAKAGDREAFARLYEGHYEAIRRYLCTALRETHEAEDAAQDVFVRALRALPDYEPRNVAIDRARRKRSAPHDPVTFEERCDADPADALEGVLSKDALRAHIARLPEPQRQIIFLRYAAGYDGNELAALTNRTPAAVRQIHCRAIAELRRRMPEPAAA